MLESMILLSVLLSCAANETLKPIAKTDRAVDDVIARALLGAHKRPIVPDSNKHGQFSPVNYKLRLPVRALQRHGNPMNRFRLKPPQDVTLIISLEDGKQYTQGITMEPGLSVYYALYQAQLRGTVELDVRRSRLKGCYVINSVNNKAAKNSWVLTVDDFRHKVKHFGECVPAEMILSPGDKIRVTDQPVPQQNQSIISLKENI